MILISLLTEKKTKHNTGPLHQNGRCFTKIEDALIYLQTQQFPWKSKNALDNVQNSESGLVIDILKERISELEIELQRQNVFINYLHSQLSLKVTNNSLSSSVTLLDT